LTSIGAGQLLKSLHSKSVSVTENSGLDSPKIEFHLMKCLMRLL